MASFILGAGVRGKRVALYPRDDPPADGRLGGQVETRVEAEQTAKIKLAVTMYAQMTGQARERVIQDLGDNYMSAGGARVRPDRQG